MDSHIYDFKTSDIYYPLLMVFFSRVFSAIEYLIPLSINLKLLCVSSSWELGLSHSSKKF